MTPPIEQHPDHHRDYVSLKEHIESRLVAIEKGIDRADSSMQIRLAGMNEFRETLKDQASKFVTRSEVDAKIDNLQEKIRLLELSKAVLDGKASQSQTNIAIAISIVGLIISIISLILRL